MQRINSQDLKLKIVIIKAFILQQRMSYGHALTMTTQINDYILIQTLL